MGLTAFTLGVKPRSTRPAPPVEDEQSLATRQIRERAGVSKASESAHDWMAAVRPPPPKSTELLLKAAASASSIHLPDRCPRIALSATFPGRPRRPDSPDTVPFRTPTNFLLVFE
ncbi:hypothetical protein, partial [Halopiger djelfimassiliensis]|uniref:hypothetical protein n=1 Tax=Halopiger djelfimassiliensis TaxID=1293047 RepID=UPI001E3603EF